MSEHSLAGWLRGSAEKPSQDFDAAHVDEFDIALPGGGLELIRACCTVLRDGATVLQGVSGGERIQSLVMFLPLGASDALIMWNKSWNDLGKEHEPPTIYWMAREHMLDEWDEEYRRPLHLPLAECEDLKALYRCWRTGDDMRHGWEFHRGIFIVLDLKGLR